MNLEQIEIQYDTYYDDWLDRIDAVLKHKHIKNHDDISARICRSLRNITDYFLQINGFRPKNYLSYRKTLIRRLNDYGLCFKITSNDTLWKYLEYFTDVDDYSKCFDVRIIVKDMYVAADKCKYKLVNNEIVGFIEPTVKTEEYDTIKNELYILENKAAMTKDSNLKHIVKILTLLNEKGDL